MSAITKSLIVVLAFVVAVLSGYAFRDVSAGRAPALNTIPVALGIRKPVGEDASATRTFLSALANIEAAYYGATDRRHLTYAAIQGMMDSLNDPYTVIMPPEEAERFSERNKGRFVGSGGIGAELTPDPLGARIRRVFKGGPAASAGLRSDDVIVRVNGEDISGKPVDEIVPSIRGEVGTTVKLTLLRQATSETIERTLTRRQVLIQDVYGETLASDYLVGKPLIGRLEVRSYSETIVEQFDEELRALESKGIKGLIIDLRGNPGGRMDAAIDMASRFIDGKLVVSMRRRDGEEERFFARRGIAKLRSYPIVILVDESTASAAEIFAGAMRDYRLATVVGDHSYGKAAVQNIETLSDGAQAKITIAHYILPAGGRIARIETDNGVYQDGGIKPDLLVELDRGATPNDPVKDNQLRAAAETILHKLR
jgi:carboxyl-terminal processing protease